MFDNIFTDHLKKVGWIEVNPMSFKKPNMHYEIFFDTSNQIEIYSEIGRMKTTYLHDMKDLIKVLDELDNVSK